MDLDDTICSTINGDYANSIPNLEIIQKMHEYKQLGFELIINTSRNMRTFSGNVGKINANTLPVINAWLGKNNVPYDEIYTGKPWCGREGFYVDDRAVRPNEFNDLSYDELCKLVRIRE